MNNHLPFQTSTRRTLLKGAGATAMGSGLVALTGSRWSAATAQEATPEAVTLERDVVYGEIDGQQLLLDVASPLPGSQPNPAVILMHGGALVFGDRTDMSDFALALAEAGYVAFNIAYRLHSPDDGTNLWPAQLEDSQRAVRWIRANAETYGVDPERIASLGHSSGGQLAAFLGTRDALDNADAELSGYSSRVQCVVDIAGPMDMTIPFLVEQGKEMTASVLGATAESPPDAEAYLDFSPIAFVDESSAPFLIFHGLADENLSIEHSRHMEEALHTAGVESVYAELTGLDHFSIAEWNVIGPETLAFLGRHLQVDQ